MNISKIHDCFGCGVCAIACGKKIINIELNANGFYEPRITESDKCTDCGFCMDVCSYNHDDLALKNPVITSYSAWSKDSAVRRKCSSGGVGFEFGKTIIAEGGKVCGVRYNAEKNIAEHYVASTDQELIPSIGSKYIQSYTVDGFAEVVRMMRESRKNGENAKFLITGTPCQIDSFRRWSQKLKCEDQFIFLDFFCHGVPSKIMWDKYVQSLEEKVGRLTQLSWRNKLTGWHDSWAIAADGTTMMKDQVLISDPKIKHLHCEHQFYSRFRNGDMFYKLFLKDACLGKACYDNCRFKSEFSSADIRIGDAWGKKFINDDNGVSAVITFTQRGEDILKSLPCVLSKEPFSVISEGQMSSNPSKPFHYFIIKPALRFKNITIKHLYLILKACLKLERGIKKMTRT